MKLLIYYNITNSSSGELKPAFHFVLASTIDAGFDLLISQKVGLTNSVEHMVAR